jgi:hypothetical protein
VFEQGRDPVGKERGWASVPRTGFDAQRGPQGALLIDNPDEVIEKASPSHAKLMKVIETIGTRVASFVRDA